MPEKAYRYNREGSQQVYPDDVIAGKQSSSFDTCEAVERSPVLRRLPRCFVPYAQLIRLDKPIGFVIVYFPYAIGILFAASISPSTIPVRTLMRQGGIFLLGSIVLRSAGCTWDDIVDQDLDSQVERSRTRPLVRGTVSTTEALLFMSAVSACGILLLSRLPWECSADAAFITALSFVYPYMKRFTDYTQVVLGLTIGFAVVMTMHALEVNPLADCNQMCTGSLWFAIALLMMLYDIVYAGQDTNDDVKAGVRSMAVLFKSHIRVVISLLASAIIACLVSVGAVGGLGPRYLIITVGGSSSALLTMIMAMDLKVPASCHKYCGGAYMLTSVAMLLGFLAEYQGRS
ncbi:uncharacterized protein LTR77_008289 [Saxophila tyrrhenica]|uniref:Uncharacterized protein n=1 Tax=Saxophila tyrrhenica TaxID=1690608 RepID=A0AAV9P150_9PEZI|nr:hypothetical protein LTR77_008289 [Saxophila tyrrhenica]